MKLFRRNGLNGVLTLLMLLLLVLIGGTPQACAEEDIAEIRKTAEQGLASAQYALGAKYDKGNGVAQDDVNAYAWFSLAAAQGNENAAENKYIITKRFNPEQQSKAKALVAELQTKIDKQTKRPSSLQFRPSSSHQTLADQAELRSWLQNIKPAAGGK